jgi:putative aminopeptidase FrvX
VNSVQFSRLAERLMTKAAAPYFEHAVIKEVESICAEHNLDIACDQYRNVIVSLQTDSSVRPIALAAHMDHPGFHIVEPLGEGRWLGQFHGGVPDSWFVPGTKVRLMPGEIPARLEGKLLAQRRIVLKETARRKPRNSGKSEQPRFAVWELADFELKKRLIHGRSCDDLIGVASALATIIDLKKARAAVNVVALISRAEEVGFHGALALAASQRIPKETLIVSLETSKELPPVKMGQGVIIRVGDRTSVFDSRATRFLTEVAAECQKKGHAFQRALMSGGTCEATAYQEFGYTTCAVCVALGNYHNCGPTNRIRAEYVSVADALSMTTLLTEAVLQMPRFNELTQRLPKRLESYLAEARPLLAPQPTTEATS